MAAYRQPPGPDIEFSAVNVDVTQPLPSRGEHVGYDPRLIDSLLRDHADLRHLFGQIGSTARSGCAHEIRTLLIDFKSRLEAHVLTENLRFYDCVEHTVEDQSDVAAMVNTFRREMDDIARAVITFVKKYHASAFSPEERCEFAMDFAIVGKSLEHRLATEEDSLYRLYRPR